MPEVDFMAIGNYAAVESMAVTIVGAGLDRIVAPQLPILGTVGIGARVTFTPGECEVPHNIRIVIRLAARVLGEGGGDVNVQFPADQGLPPGWPAGLVIGQTMHLPITEYGVYHVDLRVDGGVLKTSSFIVVDHVPPGVDG